MEKVNINICMALVKIANNTKVFITGGLKTPVPPTPTNLSCLPEGDNFLRDNMLIYSNGMVPKLPDTNKITGLTSGAIYTVDLDADGTPGVATYGVNRPNEDPDGVQLLIPYGEFGILTQAEYQDSPISDVRGFKYLDERVFIEGEHLLFENWDIGGLWGINGMSTWKLKNIINPQEGIYGFVLGCAETTPTPPPPPTPTPDSDALDYINRVENADGEELEDLVKQTINNFVVDLKDKNVWHSLSAACIMVGARTLNGALVPLKGPIPTNVENSFIEADYNRASGLKGNTGKNLNTNFLNSDLSIDRHFSFYITERHVTTPEEQVINHLILSQDPDITTAIITSGEDYDMAYNQLQTQSDPVVLGGSLNHKHYYYDLWWGIQKKELDWYHSLLGVTLNTDTWEAISLLGDSYDKYPVLGIHESSVVESDRSLNKKPTPFYVYNNNTGHRGSWYSIGSNVNLILLKDALDNFLNALWEILPPPTRPVPRRWNEDAIYSADSIPLVIDVEPVNDDINARYRFDQIGSNCPTLTCYRGTNYDFIIKSNNHPFALRSDLFDLGTHIEGSYNNDPWYGVSDKTIYFTPNEDTPDSFVYTDTLYPSNSGRIEIKNYE